ncbi:alpha/beta fold hydrolase [Streptomyces caelestis]|jgi:pimeloyl-ACP methyl ester carboxylesterase|uniref:Pimeloyl-ACP methyl ester carboxylesterase n=1 Tax=Streptomyces caelestis TaxID=36816 RepID=A0A7W9HA87_9ACTN|nr:alpha/beta hydrolase [Streptomyces caelestis]MBB5798542.1 pimeloyl-ACP methyl ester carboxylesterase [Streptomyces caelestis]GGW51104.1 hypothetical protein GCM10010320_34710 [Streptomyces caelestis]
MTDSLSRLAEALKDAESLIRAVPEGLRVASPGPAAQFQHRLDLLTGELGLPRLEVTPDPAPLWSVELALSRYLARADTCADGSAATGRDGAQAAARFLADTFPNGPAVVAARDGSPLRCWAAGPVDAPAVALVTACGMPAGLAAGWMRALSGRFRVVTWESRGLFPVPGGQGPAALGGHDLTAQADDLLAVLDGLGIRQAHAMGLCGGAVVALAAAADDDRVTSLSLWHGDYELGDEAPKTQHQSDVQPMLAMVARSEGKAAGLHALMRRPVVLDAMRADIAHHLIYPYATPLLLHRYGLLNGAIMSTDSRPYLSAPQPALVVTSRDDTTAHPAGSVYVAGQLPAATLVTRPTGDHLSAFDAGPEVVALAEKFLCEVTGDRT